MKLNKSLLKFSEKKSLVFTFLWLIAALCFCQTINAQSGRRTKKGTVAPAPPPPDAIVPKVEPPTNTPTAVEPAAKILSLVVVGRKKPRSRLSYSTDSNVLLKECVKALEEYAQKSGTGLVVKKGDTMKIEQAIEQAKKETDAHVLWFELVTYSNDRGSERFDYLDYVVFTPQDGKRLTAGRIQPEWLDPAIGQGGIRQLPSARSRNPISYVILQEGVREIVGELIRQGWL